MVVYHLGLRAMPFYCSAEDHEVENGMAHLTVQFGTGAAEMFLRVEKIDKVRVFRPSKE